MNINMNIISQTKMSKYENLIKIEKTVKNCNKCSLSKTRINTVFGEGSKNVKIMLIGEAPGRNEDKQGIPFIGRAGKLLDDLLKSVNLKRDEVYITNILKCRPPKNRNPLKKEINACKSFLDKQIEIIKPKVICPLGNSASIYILKKYFFDPKRISDIHGKTFNVKSSSGDMIIIPLYHPAYAIYNTKSKKILINDFNQIKHL